MSSVKSVLKKKISRHPQLTYSVSNLAEGFTVSERTIHNMDSRGLLPRPLLSIRRKLWSVDEIQAWLRCGCPDRRKWELIRDRELKG